MNISKMNKKQKEAYIVGLFETGKNVKDIVKLTKLPAPEVIGYRKAYEENVEAQDIVDIIKYEETDHSRHAAAVEISINELDAPSHIKGALLSELEESTAEIKGLKILNLCLQASAIQLINTVTDKCKEMDITPNELNSLSSAICKIQESFFNPNQTNVNILNAPGSAEAPSAFSKFMRD